MLACFLLFSESCSGAADGRGPISVQRLFLLSNRGLASGFCPPWRDVAVVPRVVMAWRGDVPEI